MYRGKIYTARKVINSILPSTTAKQEYRLFGFLKEISMQNEDLIKFCNFKPKSAPMKTKELIKEIQKLPLRKRIYIIERSMSIIRKNDIENQMEKAAEVLFEDYTEDKELTIFTNLDFENFYETK
jgi:hypothetical protein